MRKAFALVFSLLSINDSIAAIGKLAEQNSLIIKESYQAVFYENKDQESIHRWNETDVAQNEGFAMLLKFRSEKSFVKVTEKIEFSGAANWEFEFFQDCVRSNKDKVATCTKTIPNKGTYYSGWLVSDGDPKGLVKVSITVEDSLPEVFNFYIEEGLNLFAQ